MNALQAAKVLYASILAAEAAHPDSPSVQAIHVAANRLRNKMGLTMEVLHYEPSEIVTLVGGSAPPAPQSGGTNKDNDPPGGEG